jgi:hypothetical protein
VGAVAKVSTGKKTSIAKRSSAQVIDFEEAALDKNFIRMNLSDLDTEFSWR